MSSSFGPYCKRAFLAGFLLGFGICVALGRRCARTNPYRDFYRFHRYISPDSVFYPTLSQMIAIAKSKYRPGQTFVVVGGNSILNGVGQPLEKLWTRHLQDVLGPGYCVLNFSFRGSFPMEGAEIAAEALRAQGYRAIYIANCPPNTCGEPLGGAWYGYFYWDGLYKGLFTDSPERRAFAKTHKDDWIREMAIRMRLDSYFYFNDLWSTIGYKYFYTVWNSLTYERWYRPRSVFADFEPDAPPVEQRFTRNLDIEMKIVRGVSGLSFQLDPAGRWVPIPQKWAEFERDMNIAFPVPERKYTLIVLNYSSPFYIKKLTASELRRNQEAYRVGLAKWREAGFNAVEAGSTFLAEDYYDRTHLVPSGGYKLAELLSKEIVRINKENYGSAN